MEIIVLGIGVAVVVELLMLLGVFNGMSKLHTRIDKQWRSIDVTNSDLCDVSRRVDAVNERVHDAEKNHDRLANAVGFEYVPGVVNVKKEEAHYRKVEKDGQKATTKHGK